MKMRSPKGCVAVSHQGRPLDIGVDGSVHVAEDDWCSLGPHGFKIWSKEICGESGETAPPALVTTRAQHPLETILKNRKERPRPSAGISQAREIYADEDLDSSGAACRAEEIAALNRRALFSFLKNRGIPVSLPVTNDDLRALAARALTR